MAHHTLIETDITRRFAFYRNACISLWAISQKLLIGEILTTTSNNSLTIKEVNRADPRDTYAITIGQTTAELIGTYRMCRSFYRILCEFTGYESKFFESIDNEHNDDFRAIDSGKRYTKLSDNPVENILVWVRERTELTVEAV